ncbi:hypothetical protein CgunFtcFv8_018393 [Champsocephalus gunnari]|uniref:Uncharacterized protein n=1 Tax=Champsocephalus gunnari TaxID=52237 RepID=A0AAN8BU05_CHAGU|nr:hypothetical protein CgunFtcFv8_018393 [Champsocephalus gunnari]
MGMDRDEALEQAMLSISPSKHVQSSESAPSSSASPQQAPRRNRVPSATLSAELKASLVEAPALPAKTRVPLPKELVFLMPEPSAPTPTQTHITVPAARESSAEPCRPTLHPPAAPTPSQPLPRPSTGPSCPPPPPPPLLLLLLLLFLLLSFLPTTRMSVIGTVRRSRGSG